MALSILSVKSYAATCPDGSEPVRSISADGTYYVFNCSEPVSTAEASGNIHDGEISGVWGVGDRIKIELVKE